MLRLHLPSSSSRSRSIPSRRDRARRHPPRPRFRCFRRRRRTKTDRPPSPPRGPRAARAAGPSGRNRSQTPARMSSACTPAKHLKLAPVPPKMRSASSPHAVATCSALGEGVASGSWDAPGSRPGSIARHVIVFRSNACASPRNVRWASSPPNTTSASPTVVALCPRRAEGLGPLVSAGIHRTNRRGSPEPSRGSVPVTMSMRINVRYFSRSSPLNRPPTRYTAPRWATSLCPRTARAEPALREHPRIRPDATTRCRGQTRGRHR